MEMLTAIASGTADSSGYSSRDLPQARITTRDVGFRLGKLGIRFTSERVEVDARAVAAAAGTRDATTRRGTFAGFMDVAAERASLAASVQEPRFETVDRPTRQALSAYTRTASLTTQGAPSRLLLSVV